MTNQVDIERTALLAKLEEASTQFQHGDDAGMRAFYADSEQVTLFGALGGCASGRRQVEKILGSASRSLAKGGRAAYSVLALDVEGDLAYMAGVESIDTAAEGLSGLRVTNVFRRIDGEWRLLHRHADVLRPSPFA